MSNDKVIPIKPAETQPDLQDERTRILRVMDLLRILELALEHEPEQVCGHPALNLAVEELQRAYDNLDRLGVQS